MGRQFYYADIEQISRLTREIQQWNLSIPAALNLSDAELLRRVYNGIGPDAWSAILREVCTKMLERFEPEALIHDWEYTFQPKDYLHFTAANMRFVWNAMICAVRSGKDTRGILMQTGIGCTLALLCQLFGWKEYQTASIEAEKTNRKDLK